MRKTSLEPQQKCSTQKSSAKTPHIRYITSVPKSENFAIMRGLYPLRKRQFGSKFQVQKQVKNVARASTEMFYAKILSKNA